jgi:phytoene desaturase
MDSYKILFTDTAEMDIGKRKKAIVIGSGVGGLAIAIRLAARGMEVHVYEKEDQPGGKVSWIVKDGFRWGLGASLLTLPHLIDELFYLCKKNPADYYKYLRLDIINKYFFSDGTVIHAYADKKKFAEEIALKTNDTEKSIQNHLDNIEKLYKLSAPVALGKSLHKFSTYFSKDGISLFLTNPIKLGIFKSIFKKLQSRFTDNRTIQLFSRYATYNGSDPYKASSILNVIAHPEYNEGAYILQDGMPSLTSSLYKLATEMGVNFNFNSQVQRIDYMQEKIIGIRVNEKNIPSDYVISNMDIMLTYKHLLPNISMPKGLHSGALSTSAIIFYWGMNKKFPQLEVHNILFSDNYKSEFDALEKSDIYADPTVYIFISAKVNPSHAIKDGENWFTLINVPHDTGQNWTELMNKYRQIISRKISLAIGEDITKYIISEHVNTPASIETKTASFAGAIYGNASNKVFSSFVRHPNFSRKIKNLYFCGGTVHPGGGVPISLISAKITDELIPI